MNLGDRVRIAGREYIVDDEAFLSANPAEYRSLSWREVDANRVAVEEAGSWCSVCQKFVEGADHDPAAHGKDQEAKMRAEQQKGAAAPEPEDKCESCGREGAHYDGLCRDCADEFARDRVTDTEIERILEDRHGFASSATVNPAGRWDWEVTSGEVIVAHGTADTRAAALSAARTATNWTLDGVPIVDGFDVVATEEQPDADPCYYCGRRTATTDAAPYNGGDGGRICAACVDEHDSILRTAARGTEELYEENGKPAGTDGRELSRGTKVLVTEENIRPWGGEVGSIKWSPKSGWLADVRRDDDGLTYAVPVGMIRSAHRRTAEPAPADLGVKVGDIFYCAWGYDQTNVNWYEVVRLTGQGVEVQAVRSEVVSSGSGSDRVVPARGVPLGRDDVLIRGERKVCRLRDRGEFGAVIVLNRDYTAKLWEGNPLHETSPGWGH